MSFRYQPETYIPNPWPVTEPTELDDEEYEAELRQRQSPYLIDLDRAVRGLSTENVIVWFLFLGTSYSADTQAAREGTMQGYYIRAVVRNREALARNIRAMAPGGRFAFLRQGRQGFYREATKQLELSIDMIGLAEGETRAKVVGWGFAGQ